VVKVVVVEREASGFVPTCERRMTAATTTTTTTTARHGDRLLVRAPHAK
jgi:hypothetical protein